VPTSFEFPPPASPGGRIWTAWKSSWIRPANWQRTVALERHLTVIR
jgi:hypothetical protein